MGLLSVFISVLQAQKQPIINCGESRVPHTPCSASTRNLTKIQHLGFIPINNACIDCLAILIFAHGNTPLTTTKGT